MYHTGYEVCNVWDTRLILLETLLLSEHPN